jgi:hypothetical protein
MIGDDSLIAYLDGELAPAERDKIEEALGADLSLAHRLAQHRATMEAVRQTFDRVLGEPVPDELLKGAEGSSAENIITLPRPAATRRRVWFWGGGAIAASLLVGLFAGRALSPPEGLLGPDLTTRSALTMALNTQLSAEPGRVATVSLSFRSKDGALCRVFALTADTTAGLACRTGAGWKVRMLAPAETPSAQTYRTAASSLPPSIAALAQGLADGAPLTPQDELSARNAGWTSPKPSP